MRAAVEDLTARSVHASVTGVFACHYAMTLTTEQTALLRFTAC